MSCKRRMLSLEPSLVAVAAVVPLALTQMLRLLSQKRKKKCDRMSLKWQRCRRLLSRDCKNRTHMMPRKTQKKLRLQPPKPVVDHN